MTVGELIEILKEYDKNEGIQIETQFGLKPIHREEIFQDPELYSTNVVVIQGWE